MPRQPIIVELLETAAGQHGFVTPADAAELGVDPAQLRILAHRGLLERRGWGVYRLPQLPVSDLDDFQEAVLLLGGRGVISHESALAILQLADVNPSRIHVTVPPAYRPRRRGLGRIRVWRRALEPGDVTFVDGIPTVTAGRAIRDAIETGTDPGLVRQAIETARRDGHVTAAEAAQLGAEAEAVLGGSR